MSLHDFQQFKAQEEITLTLNLFKLANKNCNMR